MLKTTLLAAAFSLGAMAASAATFQSDGSCSVSDVSPGATECFGLADGNAQQVDLNGDTFGSDVGLFGYDDWTEFQTVGSVGGDQQSGTIDVIDNMFDQVAVLLKSGPEFAAYLFDGGLSGSLFFETANGNGLSNFLIAGRNEVPEVPLPAAGFLLLAGIGGLALFRRKT